MDVVASPVGDLAFDTLFDQLPVPAAVLDTGGRIRRANEALGNFLDATPAELKGRWLEEFLASGNLDLDGGPSSTREERYRPRSGALRWGVRRTTSLSLAGRDRQLTFIENVTAQRRAEAELDRQVMHDPLTGLPNRLLLMDRLDRAIRRARRNPACIGVLFLDLDHFKLVNDSLGHEPGDRLLQEVAERVLRSLRQDDTAARLGGDEFVILCEGLNNEQEADEIANRIQSAMNEPFTIDGEQIFMTASVGVASGRGEASPDELLSNADAAMYEAKRLGRARSAVFSAGLRRRGEERLEAERELRAAITGGEMRLLYQPIVELSTGRLHGVEALIRRRTPQGTLLGPDRIVPLAEETGMILPLGRWILREAATCAGRLQAVLGPQSPMTMSVNVSARQLMDPGFVDDVAEALRTTGCNPNVMTLEITESVMSDDIDRTVSQLHELKALGVRVAIDDFGTGYSSLNLLRQLPIDGLKVDKSFVDRIAESRIDAAVIAAIIELAGVLGLDVVAEGIEQPQQVERLVALCCSLGQGYHFARPLGEEAAHRFMADWRETPHDHRYSAGAPEVAPELEHIMQFYDRDELVVRSISDYVEAGLRRNESTFVVATADHRAAVEAEIVARGIDWQAAAGNGRLVPLDAAVTLSRFMVGGLPDPVRFEAVIGTLIRDAARTPRPLRIYGEMVSLLWTEGRVLAAIRLEELWNDLRCRHPFSLLCAYALPPGRDNVVGSGFGDICAQHTQVIATPERDHGPSPILRVV